MIQDIILKYQWMIVCVKMYCQAQATRELGVKEAIVAEGIIVIQAVQVVVVLEK